MQKNLLKTLMRHLLISLLRDMQKEHFTTTGNQKDTESTEITENGIDIVDQ